MVKELGTFFEEFTKEYLHIVEGCDIVETDRPFKITREDYKAIEGKERQAHWADIDVLGIKGNTIHIISCSETVSEENARKIQKNLIFAERAIKQEFPDKEIFKRVACISKHKKVSMKVEIVYFKDMVEFLRRNIQKRSQLDQHVRYPSEWLIRALDVVGVFSDRERAYKIYKFPAKTHIISASEGFGRPAQ